MEALVVNLERCEMCCGLESNLRLQKSGVLKTYTHAKGGHWKMMSMLRAFIFLPIFGQNLQKPQWPLKDKQNWYQSLAHS